MTHPFTRRVLLQTLATLAAVAPFASPPREGACEVSSPVTYSGAKLDRFLRSRGIKPMYLARESGYSRHFLFQLRLGRIEARRSCVIHITIAARRITRQDIRPNDLFEGARP